MGKGLSAWAPHSQSCVSLVPWLGSAGTKPRKLLKCVPWEVERKGHGALDCLSFNSPYYSIWNPPSCGTYFHVLENFCVVYKQLNK